MSDRCRLSGDVVIHVAQMRTLMALLLDDGHMTPVAVHQFCNLLDDSPGHHPTEVKP